MATVDGINNANPTTSFYTITAIKINSCFVAEGFAVLTRVGNKFMYCFNDIYSNRVVKRNVVFCSLLRKTNLYSGHGLPRQQKVPCAGRTVATQASALTQPLSSKDPPRAPPKLLGPDR